MVAAERSIRRAKDPATPYRGGGGSCGLFGIRRCHKGCAARSRFWLLETKRGVTSNRPPFHGMPGRQRNSVLTNSDIIIRDTIALMQNRYDFQCRKALSY